jgi:hypothetical protein
MEGSEICQRWESLGEAFSWYAALLRGLHENDNRTQHCRAGRMRSTATEGTVFMLDLCEMSV